MNMLRAAFAAFLLVTFLVPATAGASAAYLFDDNKCELPDGGTHNGDSHDRDVVSVAGFEAGTHLREDHYWGGTAKREYGVYAHTPLQVEGRDVDYWVGVCFYTNF